MKQIIPIILLLLICIFLLIHTNTYVEGFINSTGRCGIGLSCPDQMRCVNGYCKSQQKPKLPYLTGLPIYP
jgi:hypothetical protein